MPQTNRLFDRETAAVAIAYTLVVDGTYLIEAVRLHLSAAGGAVEDFTIANNAGAGAAYDVVFSTTAMNLVTDVHWLPERPVPLTDGDVLTIAYANTNLRTYGLEVVYRQET